MKEQTNAALKIQAVHRGRKARKETSGLLSQVHSKGKESSDRVAEKVEKTSNVKTRIYNEEASHLVSQVFTNIQFNGAKYTDNETMETLTTKQKEDIVNAKENENDENDTQQIETDNTKIKGTGGALNDDVDKKDVDESEEVGNRNDAADDKSDELDDGSDKEDVDENNEVNYNNDATDDWSDKQDVYENEEVNKRNDTEDDRSDELTATDNQEPQNNSDLSNGVSSINEHEVGDANEEETNDNDPQKLKAEDTHMKNDVDSDENGMEEEEDSEYDTEIRSGITTFFDKDPDNADKLDFEAVKNLLHEWARPLDDQRIESSDEEIYAFINHLDKDSSGAIHLNEFISFCIEGMSLKQNERVRYANQSTLHSKLMWLISNVEYTIKNKKMDLRIIQHQVMHRMRKKMMRIVMIIDRF